MTRTSASLVPLADLRPSPRNVRSDLGDIESLARSIRSVGLLSPLVVVPNNDKTFTIRAGHRRRAALARLGRTEAPCLIRHDDTVDETVIMLVENLQRAQLDPLETARAFDGLLRGRTVPEVSALVGVSAATIRARVALLSLPVEAQKMVSHGDLSLGDAAELVRSVKKSGSGSARVGPGRVQRQCGFSGDHRLARFVESRCTHAESNRRLLGPGCSQCWEQVIRADALGHLDNVTPIRRGALAEHDEAAVLRLVDGDSGDLSTRIEDRVEAVRRLAAAGSSDAQSAQRMGVTSKTVLRLRTTYGIAPGVAASATRQARLPGAVDPDDTALGEAR